MYLMHKCFACILFFLSVLENSDLLLRQVAAAV